MNRLVTMLDRDRWSESDLATLRQLVKLELPMCFIARKLERPEKAVRKKAQLVAMADMTSVNVLVPFQRIP